MTNVTHIRTLPRGMLFKRSLLSHRGLELFLGRLHQKTFDAVNFQKSIKKLPRQIECGVVIPADDIFRGEAAMNLTNERSRGNSRKDIVDKVFQELTTIVSEL